jgi:hypothetical protein
VVGEIEKMMLNGQFEQARERILANVFPETLAKYASILQKMNLSER